MANNLIAVLVPLEGRHDGLKPALTSAQQSLSEFKNSWLRRRKPWPYQSALFACVPNSQDVDAKVDQLVAHLVVSDNDATHFARGVLI